MVFEERSETSNKICGQVQQTRGAWWHLFGSAQGIVRREGHSVVRPVIPPRTSALNLSCASQPRWVTECVWFSTNTGQEASYASLLFSKNVERLVSFS